MAVEVESGGQIEEFLRVLRLRAWWIGVPVVLALALGSAFAVVVPKKYVSRTSIQVRNLAFNVGEAGQSIDEARNAPFQLKSGTRITQVLEALQWTDYLQLSRTELEPYIDKISDNIRVEVPSTGEKKELQVVKISFADTDPRRSFEFLDKMSKLWRSEVLERSRRSQLLAYDALQEEHSAKFAQRSVINEKLRELRQTFQLDPSVQGSRNIVFGASDPVYLQVSQDRVAEQELEGEIAAKRLELERGQERHDKLPPTIQRTLAGQEAVSNREQIAELRLLESQLRGEMERYKKSHSKYQLALKQINSIHEQINLLEVGEQDPVTQEQEIPNPARLDLAEAIEKQKFELQQLTDRLQLLRARVKEGEKRIDELADVYHEIDLLERDKDLLDEDLQVLGAEINQKKAINVRLQSPEGNPFEILDEPRLPGRPTEPDPVLIIVFSLFAGLGLGLALAVLVEYSKNCFRSVADISRVMVVPVLGVINTIGTRRERLRLRLTRAAIGGTTLIFVGTLAFITWAWKAKPEILSAGLRQTIEDFREGFK